jgi:hypothetical protein
MHRRLMTLGLALALVAASAVGGAFASRTLASPKEALAADTTFKFKMVASSANITKCLPHASGNVTIKTGKLNDRMTVEAEGLAPNTGYDLFVIQVPKAPFGISWYQTDLQANGKGEGEATVRGIFDVETFSVSPGGPTITFPPTHQYHLGLWFNDPAVPFNLGCEPGQTSPIVTPFNGEQHAGIQVLNTANFPDAAGPLSQIHR